MVLEVSSNLVLITQINLRNLDSLTLPNIYFLLAIEHSLTEDYSPFSLVY